MNQPTREEAALEQIGVGVGKNKKSSESRCFFLVPQAGLEPARTLLSTGF